MLHSTYSFLQENGLYSSSIYSLPVQHTHRDAFAAVAIALVPGEISRDRPIDWRVRAIAIR